MAFFSDLFDSITGQQAMPQQTIIPTGELLGRGYSTATGLAPQVAALNQAYQPIITGNQLASENQVFGPSANQLQKNTYSSILDELNLGNSVSPELQDLITTNTLQQLGTSGIGTADAGKLFGARSLLSAGLDLGAQRRNEALRATGMLPSSSMTPNVIGIPDPMSISGMIDQETAQRDNLANLQENIRRSNFSSLINTGGKILGTVAGGIFGGGIGAQMGGSIGGSLIQGSSVAGYGNKGQGGSGGGFTSILSGLGGMGGGGAGGSFGGGGGSLPGLDYSLAY